MIVRQVVPGSDKEWTTAGIDEFMRSYLTPLGRAAFYAAARNRGRKDNLVPIAFARHVRKGLPAASRLELECGHVPQLERPRQTHDAIARFLAGGRIDC